jgi:ring-1,2-phenylacetyl-CoA epoxidase subunit PaaC
MEEGLDWFWRFVDEMFEMDELETELVRMGIAADRRNLRAEFDRRMAQVVERATLAVKPSQWPLTGGRQGRHGEQLSRMLAEMQVLARAHPDARW